MEIIGCHVGVCYSVMCFLLLLMMYMLSLHVWSKLFLVSISHMDANNATHYYCCIVLGAQESCVMSLTLVKQGLLRSVCKNVCEDHDLVDQHLIEPIWFG